MLPFVHFTTHGRLTQGVQAFTIINMFYVVGLGNPGEEYAHTRHNTGRLMLEVVRKVAKASPFEADKKLRALVTEGKIGKEKVMFIEPETFMNKSGASVVPVITSEKKAAQLIVVHDDLDIGIGTMRVSFNRGAGGHKGVESIIRAIKTEKFIRVRVGISAVGKQGVKKPVGAEVEEHILGEFSKKEDMALQKVSKDVAAAIELIIKDGPVAAMNVFNQVKH